MIAFMQINEMFTQWYLNMFNIGKEQEISTHNISLKMTNKIFCLHVIDIQYDDIFINSIPSYNLYKPFHGI